MSSRLFQQIREKYGFCYSIYSFRTNYSDTSLFSIYACTSPEYYHPLMKAIEHELSQVVKGDINSKEIEESKSHLKGSLLLFMEDMEGRMKRLFRIYNNIGKILDFDTSLKCLDTIDLDKIGLFISNKLKKDKFNLLAYGCSQIKDFEASIFDF